MKLNSGKLVILTILAAAIAAAALAWWYQYQQGRRALAYWGAEGAYLIRRAPQVELLRLVPTGQATSLGQAEELIAGRPVAARFDLSQARGLVHARQALITDASFIWDDKPQVVPSWDYALRFRDGGREMLILFDLSQGAARAGDPTTLLRLGPTLRSGLEKFFAEQAAAAS